MQEQKELPSKNYNEKLIEMAKVITDAIKYAKQSKDIQLCDAAWVELEMQWFDWLEEELSEFNPKNKRR